MIAAEQTYADLLRAAMEEAGASRRKLSSAFAGKTGNQKESEYRALGKYLTGDEPTPERAAILAVLLGEPRLALVTPAADRRTSRHAELEARVAELEDALNKLQRSMKGLAALPARVTALEGLERPKRARSG